MFSYTISYIDERGNLRRAMFSGDDATLLAWQSKHANDVIIAIASRPATHAAVVDLDGRTLKG